MWGLEMMGEEKEVGEWTDGMLKADCNIYEGYEQSHKNAI